MERKKLTKKQIQQKYEDLKIDSHRRLEELRKENGELKIGAAQLSSTVDMLIGWLAEFYGVRQEDGEYMLYVPKSDKRYRIEARVREKDGAVLGYTYTAREVKEDKKDD